MCDFGPLLCPLSEFIVLKSDFDQILTMRCLLGNNIIEEEK